MAKYLIGNIKGPKGDRGEAGPTYTAGEGIDITNNVISATNSGGITTETDPVFSASPAANITTQNISDWNAKSDFSGDYDDLTNKPDLSVYATTTALGTGLARKQDTLTAGTNITIENNVISATGGGGGNCEIIQVDTITVAGLQEVIDKWASAGSLKQIPMLVQCGVELYTFSNYGQWSSNTGFIIYTRVNNTVDISGTNHPTAYNQMFMLKRNGSATNVTLTQKTGSWTELAYLSDVKTYTAGTGIDITNNVISATGSGGTTYTAGDNIDITNNEISLVDDVVIESVDGNTTDGTEMSVGGFNVYRNDNTNDSWITDSWMNAHEIGVEDVVNGKIITMTTTDGITFNDGTNTKALAMDNNGNLEWDGNEIALASDIPADELPTITSGDAGKVLTVNSGETGVEWTTPASGGGGNTEIYNPLLPDLGTNNWDGPTTKEDFLSQLKQQKLVYCGYTLGTNSPTISASDLTEGRDSFILVGQQVDSDGKVSWGQMSMIWPQKYKYYYLVKGHQKDTLYQFNSPDAIWAAIPILLSPRGSQTSLPTIKSLLDKKQNAITATNAPTSLYLKDSNNQVYEITVDTNGTLTATAVSNS